jgi:hypothetical protein
MGHKIRRAGGVSPLVSLNDARLILGHFDQMPLTSSAIKKLRQHAATGQLEVEHILKLAKKGDAKAVSLLQELSQEHHWSEIEFDNQGREIVPLGRWAGVVCAYLEGGYERLIMLAIETLPDTSMVSFCCAVLEALKTSQSVDALSQMALTLAPTSPENIDAAVTVASSLNLILSFKKAPEIDRHAEDDVRSFLHQCLNHELTAPQRATIVCALRGVGNQESIDRINELPAFAYPYDGLERSVARSIRKRMTQLTNDT